MRKSLVFALRARNVDVLTALEADMINRADADHLKTASSADRVLYTFNVADFCVLHQAWISQGLIHAGIVVASQQRFSLGQELRALMRLIGGLSVAEMRNRIEFLSQWI